MRKPTENLLLIFSCHICCNIGEIVAATTGSLSRAPLAGRIEADMGTVVKERTIVKRLPRPNKPSPLHAGARSDAAGKAVHNVILLSLPDDEYSLIRPYLEPTELPQHQILHD